MASNKKHQKAQYNEGGTKSPGACKICGKHILPDTPYYKEGKAVMHTRCYSIIKVGA